MSPLLFISGIGFAAVFGYAVRDTAKFKKVLRQTSVGAAKPKILDAIEKLLLCVQLTEVVRTIQHVGALNIITTLALFGLWLALKSGTEAEQGGS